MSERLVPPCPRCDSTKAVWSLRDFFGFSRDLSSAEWRAPVGFASLASTPAPKLLPRRLQPPAKPHWRGYGSRLALVLNAFYRALLFGFLTAFLLTFILAPFGILRESGLFTLGTVGFLLWFPALCAWMRWAEKRHDQEFPRWQAALERWRAMYYCARCDVVFLPGVPPRPPEELPALLYPQETAAGANATG